MSFWNDKPLDALVYTVGCIMTLGGLWILRAAITKAFYEAKQ